MLRTTYGGEGININKKCLMVVIGIVVMLMLCCIPCSSITQYFPTFSLYERMFNI